MKNNPLTQNNVCIILRGISGSGKSTFADFLDYMIDDCEVITCTADDYFIDPLDDFKYNFDPSKLGEAHGWCQNKAEKAMLDLVRIVIVANTSTSNKEANTYRKLAEEHDYEVVELIMNGGFKDVHNVPEAVLKSQKEKLINSLK